MQAFGHPILKERAHTVFLGQKAQLCCRGFFLDCFADLVVIDQKLVKGQPPTVPGVIALNTAYGAKQLEGACAGQPGKRGLPKITGKFTAL